MILKILLSFIYISWATKLFLCLYVPQKFLMLPFYISKYKYNYEVEVKFYLSKKIPRSFFNSNFAIFILPYKEGIKYPLLHAVTVLCKTNSTYYTLFINKDGDYEYTNLKGVLQAWYKGSYELYNKDYRFLFENIFNITLPKDIVFYTPTQGILKLFDLKKRYKVNSNQKNKASKKNIKTSLNKSKSNLKANINTTKNNKTSKIEKSYKKILKIPCVKNKDPKIIEKTLKK